MTPESKKKWKAFFEEHKYLTNMEQAQLAGLSVKSIQLKKKELGIKLKNRGWGGNGHKERPFPKVKQKKKERGTVPPSVWRNKEWFVEMYVRQGKGIRAIKRMIGRDKEIVYTHLKKYGIKTQPDRVFASTHPYCTREWLEEHYEVEGKSIRKLAQMAGVNNYTICNWLIKFCIPIRDIYECKSGELHPNYGKGHAKHKRSPPKQSTSSDDDGSIRERKRSTSSISD
jgi:transposase